jgi:hypothetical protein
VPENPRWNILLSDNFVRTNLQEARDLVVQGLQVFVCPDQLHGEASYCRHEVAQGSERRGGVLAIAGILAEPNRAVRPAPEPTERSATARGATIARRIEPSAGCHGGTIADFEGP